MHMTLCMDAIMPDLCWCNRRSGTYIAGDPNTEDEFQAELMADPSHTYILFPSSNSVLVRPLCHSLGCPHGYNSLPSAAPSAKPALTCWCAPCSPTVDNVRVRGAADNGAFCPIWYRSGARTVRRCQWRWRERRHGCRGTVGCSSAQGREPAPIDVCHLRWHLEPSSDAEPLTLAGRAKAQPAVVRIVRVYVADAAADGARPPVLAHSVCAAAEGGGPLSGRGTNAAGPARGQNRRRLHGEGGQA